MIPGKQEIRLAAWIYTFDSIDLITEFFITDFFELFNARFAGGFDEKGQTAISKKQKIYCRFIRPFRKI